MSAETGKRIHFYAMLAWLLVGLPVSYWQRHSIAWLVTLAVYSIVTGHWSGWSSEREPRE